MEDNPGDVRLIEEMLKEGAFDPTLHVVSTGPDAIDFVHQSGDYCDAPRPDAILLDLHLPRMDGKAVLTEIDDDLTDVPVIALSGSLYGVDCSLTDIEDEVDACVEKPLESDTFEELVSSLQD
ncbi:response regulator [Natronolimnohabitans sp. A-GB9]|uniref:response regulator n=1 Tax=Natronolimnohabitans sp. A-GB9 TaxID=3069757 RepID=UPI0027B79B56|nr:response regulator [Natronolimnohabitans sp. A-GB9]MDQ2051333.1 response regulator [Natronolimnohabitans sp. A-GB9]